MSSSVCTTRAGLPVSLRIVLEAVLRHCDGQKVTAEHVAQLATWKPNAERSDEIPFTVARVVLQDFTGVPLLADSVMRRREGRPPIIVHALPATLQVLVAR